MSLRNRIGKLELATGGTDRCPLCNSTPASRWAFAGALAVVAAPPDLADDPAWLAAVAELLRSVPTCRVCHARLGHLRWVSADSSGRPVFE